MPQRPDLDRTLSPETFLEYYWLKEELVSFCKSSGLPASGSKEELTKRIAEFLGTGRVSAGNPSARKRAPRPAAPLTRESIIEENFVCSEVHRAFFKAEIGRGFSFNAAFQKWLKQNAGRTYAEAIEAYRAILEEKKSGRTQIDRQFEYNTYIRAFFDDNKGRTLDEAIRCWKYKKSKKGHNRYEPSDLSALGEE